MDKAEIKARAVEAKAYVEAGAVMLESLEGDAALEARKMLEHAKTALNELDDMIDGGKDAGHAELAYPGGS